MNKTPAFLRGRKALIGMVHIGALPGAPAARVPVARLAEHAAREAVVLAKAGFDAVIIENMHDRPYVHQEHGPEVSAAMTAVAVAVRSAVGERLPVGVQVLSGGNREALAVALAAGLQFIRCENFVFSHVADEGLLGRAEAGPLLRYRRQIGAEHVAVLCDIKKKHASHAITADVPLADAAAAAEFFGADGVIVTGTATGRATSVQDVAEAAGATRLPILVGSGVTPESVGDLLEFADALIVGSWIKRGGRWENPIDAVRARGMASAFRAVSRRAKGVR
ncbi:MAG: BtpA/SgcQ family protein [Phycisphaeraceae bacterium]|nr:BtpA/SgcQ family protein [Phycisphaeraceae bacterium]